MDEQYAQDVEEKVTVEEGVYISDVYTRTLFVVGILLIVVHYLFVALGILYLIGGDISWLDNEIAFFFSSAAFCFSVFHIIVLVAFTAICKRNIKVPSLLTYLTVIFSFCAGPIWIYFSAVVIAAMNPLLFFLLCLPVWVIVVVNNVIALRRQQITGPIDVREYKVISLIIVLILFLALLVTVVRLVDDKASEKEKIESEGQYDVWIQDMSKKLPKIDSAKYYSDMVGDRPVLILEVNVVSGEERDIFIRYGIGYDDPRAMDYIITNNVETKSVFPGNNKFLLPISYSDIIFGDSYKRKYSVESINGQLSTYVKISLEEYFYPDTPEYKSLSYWANKMLVCKVGITIGDIINTKIVSEPECTGEFDISTGPLLPL